MLTGLLLKRFENDPTVKRHILKTISWRIVGSIDTILLGTLITGNINIGAQIGGLEIITKMLLYFTHERVWLKINFGIPSRLKKANKIREENAANLFVETGKITRQQREEINGNRTFTIWLTGLSASGKSSIAVELEHYFFERGHRSYVIDGDNTRLGVNSDLSFSKEDRSENVRRVAEICKLFNDAGIISIASFISPFIADRSLARDTIGAECFLEVFVDASINTCKSRDKKGLYLLAENGKIKDFTGISSPYEKPPSPDIHLHTDTEPIKKCVSQIVQFLTVHAYLERQSKLEISG